MRKISWIHVSVSCLIILMASNFVWAQMVPAERSKPSASSAGRSNDDFLPSRHVPLTIGDSKGAKPSSDDAGEDATSPSNASGVESSISKEMFNLSLCILGMVILLIGVLSFVRVKGSISGPSYSKLVGLIFIVGSSLFLITAGYSQEQITPVIAFLGTALGFMFGKGNSDADEYRKNERDKNGTESQTP